MQDEVQLFFSALESGVLGAHSREFPQEYRQRDISTMFIRQSVNLFTALNLLTGTSMFPQNTRQLFVLLASSMEEFTDSLPTELKATFEEARIHQLGTMIQLTENNGFYVEDGYEFLKRIRSHKIQSSLTPLEEYVGQKLYLAMRKENYSEYDYVSIRSFLCDPLNVYVPMDCLLQTKEQSEFIRKYSDIHELAYVPLKANKTEIYCCPTCGAVLFEAGDAGYHCAGSNNCNRVLQRKVSHRIPVQSSDLWVLNTSAVHNIFTPGQFEKKIEAQLQTILKQSSCFEYERWPEFDLWDFRIKFKNGVVWAIDAKMTDKPIYLIDDMRKHINKGFAEDRVLYVLPNRQKKTLVSAIKKEIEGTKISCVTLSELTNLLRNEVSL